MPRKSVEDLAGAAFRAGVKRRQAPGRLSAPEKALWREIVNDRAVDFFRPGAFELLEQYCVLIVAQRTLMEGLAQLEVHDADYPRMLRSVVRLTVTTGLLASRLRLSPQAIIDRRSGKRTEKGDGGPDRLLGGAAVLPFRVRDDDE